MVNHSWFTTGVGLRFGSGRVERIHHTAIWILRGFWGSDMFSFAVICFYLKYVNVYIYIDRYIIMIMNIYIYIYIYRGFWLMMVVVFWYVLIHSVILHCFALCHIEDIYIYTAGFGFVFWWVDFCLPNWPMVGKCPRSSQLASRYFQDKRLGEDSTESLDAKS